MLEANLRREFGLDQPMIVQYAKWAWKGLHGDFGISLEFKEPVLDIVRERLLMTIILAGTAAVFAWGLSIPIGIYSAVRQLRPNQGGEVWNAPRGFLDPDENRAMGPTA